MWKKSVVPLAGIQFLQVYAPTLPLQSYSLFLAFHLGSHRCLGLACYSLTLLIPMLIIKDSAKTSRKLKSSYFLHLKCCLFPPPHAYYTLSFLLFGHLTLLLFFLQLNVEEKFICNLGNSKHVVTCVPSVSDLA